MNRCFFPFALLCCLILTLFASPTPASSSKKRQKEAHLARLAAKQKAAWRAHLARVKELPRAERLALKRHERRVVRQQNAPKNEASVPKKSVKKAIKVAKKSVVKKPVKAASATSHQARLSAHNARLAARQKVHDAKVAASQKAHNARVARQQAAHSAKLAQASAAHNARLAAKRAKQVALNGDGSGGRSIQFWQTVAANVPVKVITVDLNDVNVKVSAVMARRGDGTSEPFRQMIDRANPNVAVTGTFFSLDNLKPVGDIVIGGSLVHFGGMGTALCVTPNNQASMVTVEWGRHHDWSDYDFVCACGPRLLRRGRIVLDPHAERFKDAHMLAPNSRIAVGITRGNKLVFAMTRQPIYLGRLAKVMRALGVTDAMNLDAGTSTGFYYNGATLAKPGRSLTNMIVVYGRKERYERARGQLVSPAYRRASR